MHTKVTPEVHPRDTAKRRAESAGKQRTVERSSWQHRPQAHCPAALGGGWVIWLPPATISSSVQLGVGQGSPQSLLWRLRKTKQAEHSVRLRGNAPKCYLLRIHRSVPSPISVNSFVQQLLSDCFLSARHIFGFGETGLSKVSRITVLVVWCWEP